MFFRRLKISFLKNTFMNTIRVSNSLDPYQAEKMHFPLNRRWGGEECSKKTYSACQGLVSMFTNNFGIFVYMLFVFCVVKCNIYSEIRSEWPDRGQTGTILCKCYTHS